MKRLDLIKNFLFQFFSCSIYFVMKDYTNAVITTGMSSPIMIISHQKQKLALEENYQDLNMIVEILQW